MTSTFIILYLFQMLSSPSPSSSGQLSQLGASLYGPQSELAKLKLLKSNRIIVIATKYLVR